VKTFTRRNVPSQTTYPDQQDHRGPTVAAGGSATAVDGPTVAPPGSTFTGALRPSGFTATTGPTHPPPPHATGTRRSGLIIVAAMPMTATASNARNNILTFFMILALRRRSAK
jgi:hypothetical protein